MRIVELLLTLKIWDKWWKEISKYHLMSVSMLKMLLLMFFMAVSTSNYSLNHIMLIFNSHLSSLTIDIPIFNLNINNLKVTEKENLSIIMNNSTIIITSHNIILIKIFNLLLNSQTTKLWLALKENSKLTSWMQMTGTKAIRHISITMMSS